jgi:hypothetical protein
LLLDQHFQLFDKCLTLSPLLNALLKVCASAVVFKVIGVVKYLPMDVWIWYQIRDTLVFLLREEVRMECDTIFAASD